MTSEEIYEKYAARIKELASERNCIVCNYFRSEECPKKRRLNAAGKSCDKWQYYLGKEAL